MTNSLTPSVSSKLQPITKAFSSFKLVSKLAVPHKVSLTIRSVLDDYGLDTVQEYMYHIRSNAEQSVRNLLRDVAKRAGTNVLQAIDYLDDGSPVCPPAVPHLLTSPATDTAEGDDQRG